MQYVIKSLDTGLYFSFKLKGFRIVSSWGNILNSTKFGRFNPLRLFVMQWAKTHYKGNFVFHRLVPLKANISLLGKIK